MVKAQGPRISFQAPSLYPEGITADGVTGGFYVSSVIDGTIGKVDAQGNYSRWYVDSSLKSSFGMKLDERNNLLWVCVGDPNYSKFKDSTTFKKMIRLLAINVKTGKKVKDIDLSGLYAGKHFANDITLDDQGNKYITDSFSPVIYKVDNQDKATIFVQHDLFRSIDIGLNGICWYPQGFLLVANNSNGSILKVTTTAPITVSKVTIDQFFPGADGLLRLDNNDLVLVQNKSVNKVFRLTSTDEWKSASVKAFTALEDRFQQPSTCTSLNGKLYALNSKINELQDASVKPSEEFSIQLIQFKAIQ